MVKAIWTLVAMCGLVSIHAHATSLMVTGTPSAAQVDAKLKVRIQPLALGPKGEVLPGKISADQFPEYDLGQKATVSAGRYYVSYAHNFNIVDVAEGEDKVVALQYITVKPFDGSYKVKVFTDMTSPEEQDKELLFSWLSPVTMEFDFAKMKQKVTLAEVCSKAQKLTVLGKQHCAALRGADYRALAPTIQFNVDGSITLYGEKFSARKTSRAITFSQVGDVWQPQPRIVNSEGVDGDVIAVLPGYYGVEITNLEGHTSTQYRVSPSPDAAKESAALDVPSAIQEAPSSITVEGSPSQEQVTQKLMAKIQRLPVDTHGRLAKGDLDFDLFMEMPLSLKYVVAPGKYYVGYSHNYLIVDLAPGEDKIIHLASLTVPKADGKTKFKVYTDLTAPAEQEKEILFYWLVPNILTFNISIHAGKDYHWQEKTALKEICPKAKLSSFGKGFCKALLGDDYKAMAPYYRFANDGTAFSYAQNFAVSGLTNHVYKQNGEVWQKILRILVAEGGEGETVALIPGRYILETTDGAGHVSTEFKVVAP